MDVAQLIESTRTCRRFDEANAISIKELHELINLARLAGSARNCQPWQYMLINDMTGCDKVFPHLAWAAYLKEWKGPEPGEQPAAYILCLLNHQWLKGSENEAQFDLGIASQNLLLGAAAKNISGCRIGAFSPKLKDLFQLPDTLTLELVIALGRPKEKIVIEEVSEGNVQYWHDDKGVHHVPKRKLEDIIINLDFA